MKPVSLCFGHHEKAEKTKLKFPWGWTVRGSNSCRGKKNLFSSPKSPRRALGPIQPPLFNGIMDFVLEGSKRPERTVDHSPPSSVEVKNE
jgi:hypothetical protein